MSNLLFYTDTKSTKTYGNGKSGLDNYILKKKSEQLDLIGTDNQKSNVKKSRKWDPSQYLSLVYC